MQICPTTEVGLAFLEKFFYFHEQVFGKETKQLVETVFVLGSASRNVVVCFDVEPNFGGTVVKREAGDRGGFLRIKADVYGISVSGCYLFSTLGLLLTMNSAMGELLRRGRRDVKSVGEVFDLLNRPIAALIAHEIRHEVQYREPAKPLMDLISLRALCGKPWHKEALSRWADRRRNYEPHQHSIEKDALVAEIRAEHAVATSPKNQIAKLIAHAIRE